MDTNIQLRKDGDWEQWYQGIKSFAEQRDIWQYVDPDTKDKDLPNTPLSRRQPKPEDFMEENQLAEFGEKDQKGVVTENDLSPREYKSYTETLKKYKEEIEKFNTRMSDLTKKILSTISTTLKNLVEYKMEARGILKTLKARFERIDRSQRSAIRTKWSKLKQYTTLNTATKVHTWCDKWIDLYRQMKQMKILTDERDAVDDFIQAVYPYDPEFSRSYRRMLRRRESVDFLDMVEDFREGKTFIPDTAINQQSWRTMESTSTISSSEGEHDENNENSGSEDEDSNAKRPKKDKSSKENGDTAPKKKNLCLICNQKHATTKCWALNSNDAPDNWTLSQTTRDYVFKSLAKDDNRRKIIEIYQRHRPEVRIESLIEEINMEKPSKKACMMISCSVTNANPDYALYRSVVTVTASTTHVSNDLSRMTDIREADPNGFVLFGNTANKIEYWGVFKANCKMPDGSNTTVKLLDCAYVKGFHTNIMSLQKAEKAGIYINGRKKVLEWKDGEVFCSFEKHHGFYTVEYNQIWKED
ncbi:hypothetical protein BDV18DRAFT_36366 [Aspergillus unguis]